MPEQYTTLVLTAPASQIDEFKHLALATGVRIVHEWQHVAFEYDPPVTIVPPPVLYQVHVTIAALNVRDGASTTGTTVLRQVRSADPPLPVYREFATSAGWAWLKISPDKDEWISGKYAVKI